MLGYLYDYRKSNSLYKNAHEEKMKKIDESFMSCFGAEITPVSHFLAKEYAVCDQVTQKI